MFVSDDDLRLIGDERDGLGAVAQYLFLCQGPDAQGNSGPEFVKFSYAVTSLTVIGLYYLTAVVAMVIKKGGASRVSEKSKKRKRTRKKKSIGLK